jgi:hypothetical protein
MVFALHKFKHYLLGNKIIFYEDHMALVYLVNKPQISRSRWLLLFLEYDFIVVYKLGRTHVVTDALSRLLDITEPTSAPDQTTYASLFYRAWIVEWCKIIFENKEHWGNIVCIIELETGWESRAFLTKKWWIVQNGPRQQIAKMFDNYKSTYGDERIAWRTIKRPFCNWNHIEEDIGCGIFVANFK